MTATGAAAVLAFTTRLPSGGTALAQVPFSDYPFTLGVASGDPLPDSVVLWTRLAPKPVEPNGGMLDQKFPVQWQVAKDERFSQVVREGTTFALPEFAHSVHVDVKGLEPGREYYYRFKAGAELSPIGRTKTAPAAGPGLASFSFAFASCQNYPAGFYTAYQHMADEDLDLVIHLGDYIYEGPGQGTIGRGHLPAAEIFSLQDYRVRYAQHKADPDLQAAHAAFPWIVTWDDHEVENNYAGAISENNDPVAEFLQRRANAYRAYWEHMPLRPLSKPSGPDAQLYRRFTFGTLAEINVLDGRQYRDDQVCGGGQAVPCEDAFDPSRSMLGATQEQWLLDGLGASAATWNVLAQQTVMARADRDPGPGELLPMDNWNGYEPARQRLFDGVIERGVDNMVVVTGDAHCSMVADLKQDFDDPSSATVGVEFLGTSISSGGDGVDLDRRGEEWLASNPHMKFYNGKRGYVRCMLTPGQWRSDYRVVPYVTEPGAPISTQASFVVEDGVPGVQPV